MVKRKQFNKADQKFYEVNREHKSSLFCISFREKKDLLELLEKCKRLKDYAIFIHYIRENQAKSMSLTDAVDEAIDRCIEENIMKELLVKCRGEVRDMVLSTYNKEVYERDLKTEGKMLMLIEQVQKKCLKNKTLQEIVEKLEENIQNIEPIYQLVKENPDKTETDILQILQAKGVHQIC